MEFITRAAAYLFSATVGYFAPSAAPAPKAYNPVLSPAPQVQKLSGKTVPAFSMKLTDGRTLTDKQLRGKVVLLDFWATWCAPCKAASPLMNDLFKKHNKEGLVVIGADVMENKPGAQFAKKYRADNKYEYYFSYDNDKLHKEWELEGVPTFVLIDHKGKVIYVADRFNDEIEKTIRTKVTTAVRTRNSASAEQPPSFAEWLW